MDDVKVPNEVEKANTARVLRSIAEIIENSLHFGRNAHAVQDALTWLKTAADFMVPPQATPDLKAVKDDKWQKKTKRKK